MAFKRFAKNPHFGLWLCVLLLRECMFLYEASAETDSEKTVF